MCLVVDVVENGPHTSEWTRSRIAYALISLSWKEYLEYFPKVRPLHVSTFSSVPLGRPVEICCNIFKAPWCKRPNHLCHNLLMSRLNIFSTFELKEAQSSTSILYRLWIWIPIFFTWPMAMCRRNAFPFEISHHSLYPQAWQRIPSSSSVRYMHKFKVSWSRFKQERNELQIWP